MIKNHKIIKVKLGSSDSQNDHLAMEEPLQISITQHNQKMHNIALTMRTPGHDSELALGFLFGENIIQNTAQIEETKQISDNHIEIITGPSHRFDTDKLKRNFYTTSSCGVCGKASIESINTIKEHQVPLSKLTVDYTIITSLPNKLKKQQATFQQTGGLHAAALFDQGGTLISLKEDVGRHNALDKIIGDAFAQSTLPLESSILLLSGRASFELIQKAVMAGIQIVAAIGAPSSLAVELAEEYDITLIGFLKHDGFNIYCSAERVIMSS